MISNFFFFLFFCFVFHRHFQCGRVYIHEYSCSSLSSSFLLFIFFFISQTINHRFLYYLYIENKIRNKTTTTKTKWNIIPNVSSTIYKFIIYLFKKKNFFVMFKSEKLSDVLIIRKFGVFFFLLFHFFLTDVIYITLVYMTKKKKKHSFTLFILNFFFFFHHHHFKFIV